MPVPEPPRQAPWLLVPVLLLAAACGGSDPEPAAASSPTPGATASAPAPSSTATSPAAQPSEEPSVPSSEPPPASPSARSVPPPSAAGRTAPACRTDQLELSVEAPADDVLLLLLTNVSPQPCAVEGHPAVTLLDDGQQQVFYPASDHADAAPVVVLDPGAVGNALLTAEVLTCEVAPPSSFVRVVPPAQAEALVAPAELAACATMVSAVHPGRTSPLRTS